jgi:nucleoside-diphosphate-sugar epimerase
MRSLLDRQDPVLRSDGHDTRDYIYVRDVVSAYLLLAEYVDQGGKAGEAFNFSSGARHSVLEMVDAIGSATGLLAHAKILGTATMEIRDQALDTGKARNTLGWQPRWSLNRGLQETAEWYRTHLARRSASVLV